MPPGGALCLERGALRLAVEVRLELGGALCSEITPPVGCAVGRFGVEAAASA